MTYQLVTLVLGLVAIACAWDVARRFAGASQSRAQSTSIDEMQLALQSFAVDHDRAIQKETEARVDGLEAQLKDMRNLVNSAKPARPWGAMRARTGA